MNGQDCRTRTDGSAGLRKWSRTLRSACHSQRGGGRMTASVEQVLTAALDLPDDDRMELVEALIVSFQPADQPPFDDSWREVIRRRSVELTSGQVVPVPWTEVKQRAREAVGG